MDKIVGNKDFTDLTSSHYVGTVCVNHHDQVSPTIAAALMSDCKNIAQHKAKDYSGFIWCKDTIWYEQVFQGPGPLPTPVEELSAPTLNELITIVREKYGKE
jgi:hypothetical protein